MSDELDHILSQGEEIIPSSGFLDTVMEAVREQADAPQPIPFPWKRAFPALALLAVSFLAVLTMFLVLYARAGNAPLIPAFLPGMLRPLLNDATHFDMVLSGVALFLTFASARISVRFVTGSR